MSMKRTKQRGAGGRDKDVDETFWQKPSEPEKTWQEHVEGKADVDFVPYVMTSRYAKGQLVNHSKFGRGIIVDADASRVEILFETGKKKLGHGHA